MAKDWEEVQTAGDAGWEDVETPRPSVVQEAATNPREPSILQDLFEAFKAAPTESAAAAGTGSSMPFALTGWVPFSEKATQAQQELPQRTVEDTREALFGYRTAAPETTTGRYVGTGIKAALDPANIILSGAKAALPVAEAVARGFTTGIAAEGGGDIGAATEKGITGKETGFGRVAGTLFGATATGFAQAPTKEVFRGGTDFLKQIWDKYKNVAVNPEQAEQAVAAGAAKNFLKQVAISEGVDNIDTLLANFKDASQYVAKQDAPLMFAMSQNPVMKAEIIRQAKSNPEAMAALQKEVQNIASAIDQKASKIFGNQAGISDVGIKTTPIQRKINNLDKSIKTLSSRIPEGKDATELSNAISTLIEKKSTAVKQELSDKYNALKAEAKIANVTMPEEATRDMFAFYQGNRIEDLFGVGTETSRKIGSILKPEAIENPNIDPNITALERAAGRQPETIDSYRKLTFDDIDSMKRMINREQRITKDPAKLDKINKFEEQLDVVREKYMPEWSDRLRQIDTEYFERMGIPFRDAQAMKEIDSVKYASNVAPIIIKNIDSYKQFMGAVGPEGKTIAQNAMMSKAWSKVVKDGVVSKPALVNFLKENKAILSQMPEVEGILKNTVLDDTVLRNARARLDVEAKAVKSQNAQNFLLTLDDSSYPSLVNSLLNSQQKRTAFVKNIKNLSPDNASVVRSSLRSALAQRALESGEGAVNFLTNPKNKVAIETIMGPGYQESLRKISIMSDQLRKVNLDNILTQVTQRDMDIIAKFAPGLDIPYVSSQLRDRLTSFPQKVVRMLSRINVRSTQTKYDALMLELLTDPNGVEKLRNVTTDMTFSLKNPFSIKKLVDTALTNMPPSAYIGLTTEDSSPEDQGFEIYTNQ